MKESTSDITDWIFGDDDDEKEDDDDDDNGSITRHVCALVFNCSNTSEVSIQNDYAGVLWGKQTME